MAPQHTWPCPLPAQLSEILCVHITAHLTSVNVDDEEAVSRARTLALFRKCTSLSREAGPAGQRCPVNASAHSPAGVGWGLRERRVWTWGEPSQRWLGAL